MTVSTHPTVAVRVPTEVADRINSITKNHFKGRTADATRSMLNVGIFYYENYDTINDPKQKEQALAMLNAMEPAEVMDLWQKRYSTAEFKEYSQLMTTMHSTRYDEKHELQKQIVHKDMYTKSLEKRLAAVEEKLK